MDEEIMTGKTDTLTANPRREFLRQASLLAGGAALLGTASWRNAAMAAVMTDRSYVSGNFALELDGQFVGFLKSYEGGFAKADVIPEPYGSAAFIKKHIGQPKYQDLVMQCDPILPKPLYDWVAATLNTTTMRKNGAIITASYDYKEQSRLQFNQAMISEIAFPEFDAASKEPAYTTIKLALENSSPVAGSSAQLKGDIGAKKQHAWLPSNFRLSIAGLDCTRINKIEPLIIKRVIQKEQLGDKRDYAKEPTRLEFPNLSFTLPEINAGSFYAWFQDMVIKGNSDDKNERQGSLQLLSPDLKTVLQTINFQNLGIFGFAPEKAAANADQIRRVRVDLYCERITLG